MRKARDIIPNVSYHVITRANPRELILNTPEKKESLSRIMQWIPKCFCHKI